MYHEEAFNQLERGRFNDQKLLSSDLHDLINTTRNEVKKLLRSYYEKPACDNYILFYLKSLDFLLFSLNKLYYKKNTKIQNITEFFCREYSLFQEKVNLMIINTKSIILKCFHAESMDTDNIPFFLLIYFNLFKMSLLLNNIILVLLPIEIIKSQFKPFLEINKLLSKSLDKISFLTNCKNRNVRIIKKINKILLKSNKDVFITMIFNIFFIFIYYVPLVYLDHIEVSTTRHKGHILINLDFFIKKSKKINMKVNHFIEKKKSNNYKTFLHETTKILCHYLDGDLKINFSYRKKIRFSLVLADN
ncbi:MAG: hypothetical protein ACTSVI_10985 [Promethearchaeota archaeon]